MLYFKFLSIISKHFVPNRKATLFISWLLLLFRFSFDLITTSFSQDFPRVFMVVVMIHKILLLKFCWCWKVPLETLDSHYHASALNQACRSVSVCQKFFLVDMVMFYTQFSIGASAKQILRFLKQIFWKIVPDIYNQKKNLSGFFHQKLLGFYLHFISSGKGTFQTLFFRKSSQEYRHDFE